MTVSGQFIVVFVGDRHASFAACVNDAVIYAAICTRVSLWVMIARVVRVVVSALIMMAWRVMVDKIDTYYSDKMFCLLVAGVRVCECVSAHVHVPYVRAL